MRIDPGSLQAAAQAAKIETSHLLCFYHRCRWGLFLALISISFFPAAMAQAEEMPWIGIDANYSMKMEEEGKSWNVDGKKENLFGLLRKAGCNSLRVRVWTGDEGVNGLKYALRVAQRGQENGLQPNVVIFLSEDWADFVKQPVPVIWKTFTFYEKLRAVEAYAEKVARAFEEQGIQVNLFEIGNEIDFGICGEFEEEWAKRVSIPYMKANIWPKEAQLILAAQKGVLKVRPEAKFSLHLSQWNHPDYCLAFWQSMMEGGVTLDYPGLSYFPTSVKTGENSTAELLKHADRIRKTLGKQVLICEYGYPSEAKFTGQFADWNHPVEGYALDEEGQRKWLQDFVRVLKNQNTFAGAWYWSPEWYASDMWSVFSLFRSDGKAKLALTAFTGRSNGGK